MKLIKKYLYNWLGIDKIHKDLSLLEIDLNNLNIEFRKLVKKVDSIHTDFAILFRDFRIVENVIKESTWEGVDLETSLKYGANTRIVIVSKLQGGRVYIREAHYKSVVELEHAVKYFPKIPKTIIRDYPMGYGKMAEKYSNRG